jgi:hypothetical protein
VEEAQRRRICHRKRGKHSIEKGAVCLVISDENGRPKNYCIACAPEILKKAQQRIAEFSAALGLLSHSR